MSPGQICPNCHKGFLFSKGKRYRKCNKCGYIKYKSPHGHQEGSIMFPPKEKKKEEIPSITLKKKDKQHAIEKGEGYHTEEYKDSKYYHDEQIRLRNKAQSIEKILAKLRKNKYSGIKEIEIEGEIWDVETGKLVREKEKPKEEEKEEFAPDRVIEDMVSKESG